MTEKLAEYRYTATHYMGPVDPRAAVLDDKADAIVCWCRDLPTAQRVAAALSQVERLKGALEAIVAADDGALAEYRALGLGEPPPEVQALTEQARAALAGEKS